MTAPDRTHRLIVVPRWAGTPESDYYPWLTRKLATGPLFTDVRVLAMPDPGSPVIRAWVDQLLAALGQDPAETARTVLLGHSVGAQTVLRALAELPPGRVVAGALLVAAWFSVDRPWEAIRPWMETPVDLDRARAAAGRIDVLLSDNDPFTADFAENRRAWEERVGANVTVRPGEAHFNRAEEPSVLAALEALTR
jgi:predicted alpha/beta hydrolase family esterase